MYVLLRAARASPWRQQQLSSVSQTSWRLLSTEDDSDQRHGHYTPVTKQLWQDRIAAATKRSSDQPIQDLNSKPPEVTQIVYPFTADKSFKELYRNPWNFIRIGNILEDLDSLAGNIAFQHCCRPGHPPPLLVTASVDDIALHSPISIEADVAVRGQVVWTGTSALDIRMELWQQPQQQPSLVALFSFVHLDPATKRPAPVVQLTPVSPQDKEIAAQRQALADERRRARQAQAASGGQMLVTAAARKWTSPLLAEARLMSDLPALAPSDAVLMPSTVLQNTFITQPQQQNMHGRVFGGFLMRRAYELAFATTYTFAGARPAFVMVDEVSFKKPVDVGDLLRFKSTVLHTQRTGPAGGLLYVEVEASVAKPERLSVSSTNTFLFVFSVAGLPQPLRRVLPSCEEEAARAWSCSETAQKLSQKA